MIRRQRPIQAVAAAIATFTVFAGAVVAAAPTRATGGLDVQFTATHQGPQQYPNIYIDWDVPITMSDGTVLKANVYHPADASGQPIVESTPTIVNLTPYTKLVANIADSVLAIPGLAEPLMQALHSFDLSAYGLSGISDLAQALAGGTARTFAVDRKLVQSGYTQVVVDVRGTGFSQGTWQVFGEREQQDGVEVVDWAAAQPWSNGKIGMSGISYSAINQLQTAERRPAALQAIFPIVPGSDLIRDVAAPGALGIGFIPEWLLAVDGSKVIPDVVSMLAGKFDWTWLADRVRDPFTFFNMIIMALGTQSMDQTPPEMNSVLDDRSPLRTTWIGHPDRITVPSFVYGGWQDIFA